MLVARRLLAIVFILSTLVAVTQHKAHSQPTAPTAQNVTLVAYQKAVPKRYTAMRFAISKRGGWYLWGGNGPRNYDCSGLVMAAYKHAGISLPRTTTGMLSSSKLIRIPRSQARWGMLVFFGSGHVELVSSAYRYSFGAHHSGTQIGYRAFYGHPTFYRVRGA